MEIFELQPSKYITIGWARQQNGDDNAKTVNLNLGRQRLSNLSNREKSILEKVNRVLGICETITKGSHCCHQSPAGKGESV